MISYFLKLILFGIQYGMLLTFFSPTSLFAWKNFILLSFWQKKKKCSRGEMVFPLQLLELGKVGQEMRPLTDPAHPPDRQLNEHLKIIRLKSLFSAASTTRYRTVSIFLAMFCPSQSTVYCAQCTPYSVQMHR